MEITIKKVSPIIVEADAIIYYLLEGQADPLFDEAIGKEAFTGKLLETCTVHRPTDRAADIAIAIGLGKADELTPAAIRQAAAKAAKLAGKEKAQNIASTLPESDLPKDQMAQALVEGFMLGSYSFTRYKTTDRQKIERATIKQLTLLLPDGEDEAKVAAGLERGQTIAAAILNTRDIVNEPPSHIKPKQLVKAALEIANLSKNIKVTILDKKELAKEGYNALLAVGAGSAEPPYLIHLHYRPAGAKKRVSLVGKGVTFDSGGLSLKPWNAMLSMKTDMAGGAAVLGIFQALAELEQIDQAIPIEVDGIIPACENMISGGSMRPDDIIITKNGKTIEVLHTDAEGRLILADALTYAMAQEPNYIIDFATLTGAAIVALGRSYAAVMGNNPELLQTIEDASRQTGELSWELPLPEIYKTYLESQVADLQNISSNKNAPGAIYGGLFLAEFVDQTPWAHIDIAGPSFAEEDSDPVYPKGATGYGVLLGLELLKSLQNSNQTKNSRK